MTTPAPEQKGPEGARRLGALERAEKWYLSAGDGFLWAPPFPRWLHRPGFWDGAHVFHYSFAPLFGVVLVDADGREVGLDLVDRSWRPDRMRIVWRPAGFAPLVEQRCVLPRGRFCSFWTLPSDRTRLHLVAFTVQPGLQADVAVAGGIRWSRRLEDRHGQRLAVTATLSAHTWSEVRDEGHPLRSRVLALRTEGRETGPDWAWMPFREVWRAERWTESDSAQGPFPLEGLPPMGLVAMAVDVPLGSGDDRVGFVLEVRPEWSAGVPGGDVVREGDPLHSGLPHPEDSAVGWAEAFDTYPALATRDPYLGRYFDYRVYGLQLNRLAGGCGNVRHPAIAEGIEYFHVPITYSGQAHMWETRWSSDPSVARGTLLNFLDNQKSDGAFHGRLYPNHLEKTDFYHANWGDAALAVDAVHPDRAFLERAYRGLGRYAEWLDAERDPGDTGIYRVVNHNETGQEYMSRYLAVDPESDRTGWQPRLHLGGVDVTVYAYQLKRALAEMARRLGRPDDAGPWDWGADRIGRAILERMWDPDAGLFSDIDIRTGQRTGVKAGVCFYPLLTDLLDPDHVERLLEHLADPGEFATPFPVPSSSLDDPFFSAEGEWKGKRHNCPWNGRVWPMVNSHVVEGLLRQWHAGRRAAGHAAADILTRFIRMMFTDGDPSLPNCYEHYNPFTGHPCTFRGIDDYQHSWVLDLLVRGFGGLEPLPGRLLVDPLPMGQRDGRLSGLVIQGRRVSVTWSGPEVQVDVDGVVHEMRAGAPMEVAL